MPGHAPIRLYLLSKPKDNIAVSLITTNAELEELCLHLAGQRRFGLDMEFIPERTYLPQLCLIQIAVEHDVWLIDPLAFPDLSRLWKLMADPGITKILHAAEQDLWLINQHSNLIPQNIFDTQIAAGFIGLGYPLGYGKLTQTMLGKELPKSESFTDWAERPLSSSQLDYAEDDVRYLCDLADALLVALKQRNRLNWALDECNKYIVPAYYDREEALEFLRVKGASSLSRRGLAVLRELTAWRHEYAAQANRPVKTLLNDNILIELAKHPPRKIADISRIRGIRPDLVKRYGDSVLAAVSDGLDLPDAECPRWPSGRSLTKQETLLADMLFFILKVLIYEEDVATELVATRTSIESLVKHQSEGRLEKRKSNLPLLNGWRWELAGKYLVDILQGGEISLAVGNNNLPVRLQLNAPKQ